MQKSGSSIVRRLVRTIALIISVTMAAPVMAQGAGGVADPMSLRSTMDLFGRYTTLEPEQRIAIESAHDRYLEAYEQLREGEIQEFLDLAQQSEAGSSGRMPDLDQMERLLVKWNNVNRRVGALDARLFEEIGAGLDAEQGDALARVGLIRGRQRFQGANGMLGRRQDGGIDTAFWRIEPTEAERLAVDDILRGYEAVMPRLVEDHSKASVGMVRDILRSMNESGYANLTREQMQDPEVVQDVMAAMSSAQQAAMQPMFEAMTEIEDRGISASKGFRTRLAPDRWYRMKRIWMSSAFPGTGMGLTGGNELDVPRHAKGVRAAIADDPDRVAALESILGDWYAKEDRQTDELIELSRQEAAQEFLDPMNLGNVAPNAVRDVHVARREAAEGAIRALLELIPDPEARAAIEKRIKDGESVIVQGGYEIPVKPRKVESDVEDPAERKDRMRIANATAARYIPIPISREDLDFFGWLMGMDAGEALVMETLHADYLDTWTATIEPLAEKVKGGLGSVQTHGGDVDVIEERAARNRAALEAVLELEDDFFDDIGLTIGDDARKGGLEAMRVQRAFDRIDSITSRRFDALFGIPLIEPASPYRLLFEMELDDAVRDRIREDIIERNADLRAVVEGREIDRLESDVAFGIATAPLAYGEDFYGGTVEEAMAASAAMSQRYLELARERASVRRSETTNRRNAVQAVVDESVIPGLSSLDGLRFQLEMFEQGWGGVRKSHDGLDIALKVLRMDDLDEDQAVTVETLLVDHLERETELIEDLATDMSMEIERFDSSGRPNEKFVFRRGEIQERLIQKLLAILTPEQIARVPALANRAD